MTIFSPIAFFTPGRRILAACLLLASAGLANAELSTQAYQAQSHDTSVEAQNKATVKAAFERWRAGGNVFTDLLAADVVWTIHGSGAVAGTYKSLEDFVERGSGPLTSRLTSPVLPDVHHIFADGDVVVVRFNGSATTTSGSPYRNQFVWMFRMKDGSVTEAEAFLDLAAYQQVVDNNEPRVQ